jgi:hypothetical protein
VLEFATHHAGTALHARFRRHADAQFTQRYIGLRLHHLANDRLAHGKPTEGTMPSCFGCDAPGFPQLLRPVFDGAQRKIVFCRNLGLRERTRLQRRPNALTQIHGIGFHTLEFTRSIPQTKMEFALANRSRTYIEKSPTSLVVLA